MDDLEILRGKIDDIDKELVKLFEERMDVVLKVLEYKKKNNLEIFHKSREDKVISRNLSYLKDKSYEKYLIEFMYATMDISKKLQRDRL